MKTEAHEKARDRWNAFNLQKCFNDSVATWPVSFTAINRQVLIVILETLVLQHETIQPNKEFGA